MSVKLFYIFSIDNFCWLYTHIFPDQAPCILSQQLTTIFYIAFAGSLAVYYGTIFIAFGHFNKSFIKTGAILVNFFANLT